MKLKTLLFTLVSAMILSVSAVAYGANFSLVAVDDVHTGINADFTSVIEMYTREQKSDDDSIDFRLKLENAKFTKNNDEYLMNTIDYSLPDNGSEGIIDVNVLNDSTALVTANSSVLYYSRCRLPIKATSIDAGDIVATLTSNSPIIPTARERIATAYSENVEIYSDGVRIFTPEMKTTSRKLYNITIDSLIDTPENFDLELKLKGDFKYTVNENGKLIDRNNEEISADELIDFLNTDNISTSYTATEDVITISVDRTKDVLSSITGKVMSADEDKIKIGEKNSDGVYWGYTYSVAKNIIVIDGETEIPYENFISSLFTDNTVATLYRDSSGKVVKIVMGSDSAKNSTPIKMSISNIYIIPTEKCDLGDIATITVSSDWFDSVKLEVAYMHVIYTVENNSLPVIEAGKANSDSRINTLEINVSDNSGEILNPARKGTFTFPEGINVIGVKIEGADDTFDEREIITLSDYMDYNGNIDINNNKVTIRNYGRSNRTDFTISFVINASESYSGDVPVLLGGEFDNVSLTVATVKGKEVVIPDTPVYSNAELTAVVVKGTDFSSKIKLNKTADIAPTDIVNGTDAFDVKFTLINGKFNRLNPVKLGHGVISYELTGDNTITLKLSTDIYNANMCTIIFNASAVEIGDLMVKLTSTSSDFAPITAIAAYSVDKNGILNTSNEGSSSGSSHSLSNTTSGTGSSVKPEASKNENAETETPSDTATSPKISMSIGDTSMTIGDTTVTFDTAPYINKDNRSMFPVRAI
ncbi:MAG: hypothetical protein PUD43_05260, partial [Clostridia bacterium]|nr:hypothetical protein [Clostridia bacterium]